MGIKYITNVRIPTSRAHGYAIMKMCEKFAENEAEVDLIVPNRRNNEKEENPFVYYGIKNNFKILKLNSIDLLGSFESLGKLFYWIDLLSFFVSILFKKIVNLGDIIFTRDFTITLLFSKKKFICLELHDIPKSIFLFKRAIKKPRLFFVLNKNIKAELVKMGVKENKIHIFPSGVEIKDFDISINQEEARKKIALPLYKKIILYAGQFYVWKGTETLAQVAPMIPEAIFVFIGGVDPELAEFKNNYGKHKNIIIKPFQERSVIPFYLKAADVLVIPQSSKEKISAHYSSPLKMFEYMASGRPIVASDLSSIKETLDNQSAVFAEPDNPESFAFAINEILENFEFAKKIADNAFGKVKQYSWNERAKKILEIIKNCRRNQCATAESSKQRK